MSALAQVSFRMSVRDFLAWEPGDGLRYELVDGEPRAMAPAGTIHGFLQNELGSLIRNHLRDRRGNCEVVANPGVIPQLLSAHNVRVPDLGVTCSPLVPGQATLPDPVLLIEILSPEQSGEDLVQRLGLHQHSKRAGDPDPAQHPDRGGGSPTLPGRGLARAARRTTRRRADADQHRFPGVPR